MEEKRDMQKGEEERKSDDKCTAGNLPEKQDQFEDSTWVKNANHGVSATEAERKNVSKTLPDTAEKEKGTQE